MRFELVLSNVGPPESPKHVPPLAALLDRIMYVFGGLLFSVSSHGFDFRRVSPPTSLLPVDFSSPYPTVSKTCFLLSGYWFSHGVGVPGASRAVPRPVTGAASRSTPTSWTKKARSSYCGCGVAVARCHSGLSFRAFRQATYRPALLPGMKPVLGGRMPKFGADANEIQT